MADNVTSELVVSAGQVFAADVIGSVAYVRNKIVIGADGTNDGDVCTANPMPISDAGGSITVDGTVAVSGSVAVTNAGTFAVQVSSALPSGTNAIGKLAANSGVTIGAVEIAAAQTLGTVTTVSTVTAVTTLGTITNVVHVDDNSGSLTVDAPVATPVFVRLSDGAAAITTLPVSLASVPSHAVTNAGTFAVQAASAGDVAHDGADSGNPLKNGFKATTALSGLTLVSNADRTDGFAGVDGVQIVRPHCNLEDICQDRGPQDRRQTP